MTPVVAKAVKIHGFGDSDSAPIEPSRMVNSPTKPFSPGRPMLDRTTMSDRTLNTGMIFHTPP